MRNTSITKDNEIERLQNELARISLQSNSIDSKVVEERPKTPVNYVEGNVLPRRNVARQKLPATGISRRQMPAKR
jgi:hypothetical protein